MKKFIKIFICIVMSAVLAFVAAACKKGDGSNNNSDEFVKGEYILKGGKSDYKIVVPADMDKNEKLASEELQEFFLKSTGVTLPIVSDDGLTYTATARYFSIDKNTLSAAAGITADYATLGSQGFVLKTVGNSVFMVGAQSLGSLYAVYEFMYRMFKFEVFSADECYVESRSEIGLYKLDFTDRPDIEYRLNGYGYFSNSAAAAKNATRLRITDSPIMGVGNGYIYNTHNATRYFTEEQFADNPEFLSTDRKQLCYTARGNSEKLKLMQEIVLDVMKDAVINNPSKSVIALMQEDHNTWCACTECDKIIEDRGGYSAATQILFINAVAKQLKEWVIEAEIGRDIKIVFFAYHKTTQAPVVYNETTKAYQPITDDVIMEDNVAVYYAPVTSDYYYSFKDDKNISYANIMKGWSTLSKNVFMWVYSTNFRDYLVFYDSFGSMVDNYRFMRENNTYMVFENTQYNNTNSTAFHVVKGYLNAKLGWDADADYNELLDRFFNVYFKDAAATMRTLFDQTRLWTAKQMKFDGLTGDIYEDLQKADLWPFGLLCQWEGLIQQAFDDIEPLKDTNLELYYKLYDRIRLENVSIQYLQILLYGGRYNSAELLAKKLQFRTDATDLNISNQSEAGGMRQLFNQFGV